MSNDKLKERFGEWFQGTLSGARSMDVDLAYRIFLGENPLSNHNGPCPRTHLYCAKGSFWEQLCRKPPWQPSSGANGRDYEIQIPPILCAIRDGMTLV